MQVSVPVRWFRRHQIPFNRPGKFAYDFDPLDFSPSLKTKLLIMQPTPFCNLDCSYCYLPDRDSNARMSLDTVRKTSEWLLSSGLAGTAITVVWHAGEPLVAGLEFFESAVEIVARTLGSSCAVTHSIQTNATLINDRWCDLFRRHGISIGVSVDGPADLHDAHRRTRDSKATHHVVMRGIETLRRHDIPFHVIAVVTPRTLARADYFYDFFLEHSIREVGCNFDEAEGVHANSSVEGNEELHRAFLERLIARSTASGGAVQIRELANAFGLIARMPPGYQWRMHAFPENAQVMPFVLLSVAWNGDFSTFSPELLGQRSAEYDDFILGNVHADDFLSVAKSERFRRLWNAVFRGVLTCESGCTHFNYCGGGAPANKLYENGTFESGETLYCRTMIKRPFNAVLEHIEALGHPDEREPEIAREEVRQ